VSRTAPGTHDDPDDSRSRRLPASERRAVILEAALSTFALHGYDRAAMDVIAAAAGVSKAVVYDHVASKRQLYIELLESIRSDLTNVVETALGYGGSYDEPRVRAAIEAFFDYVDEHRQGCRLLFLEVQGANVSEVGRELEERISARLAVTLAADPRLLARHPERERQLLILGELLKSAIQGLASWWMMHPEIAREELVERTVALVWPALVRAAA
jgi:AcrR family transcriptional regulator